MSQLVYWSKSYNWRRTSCNRYLNPPNDNCLLNNEAYINCPKPHNHSSNLFYHQGILYLTWFSGDHEGDDGCNIYISRLMPKSNYWSDAELVVSKPGFACQGSCIFYNRNTNKFIMIYTCQEHLKGDPASQLYKIESDDTYTWSEPVLFDAEYGVLIRNRVVRLDINTLILPYYFCNPQNAPNYIWNSGYYKSNNNGYTWKKFVLEDTDGLMEPVIINLGNDYLRCYYRDKAAKYIYMNQSSNKGETWTKPERISVENNDSALDIMPFKNRTDSFIMCCNRKHDKRNRGRTPLTIFKNNNTTRLMEEAHGEKWEQVVDLDPKMDMAYYVWRYGEFSYPAMEMCDNFLHVAYTYNRQTIKYVRISLDEYGIN